MEYQVTKPAFVRVNWTQIAFTFAACLAACLLAGGAFYAVIYFTNRKSNNHGNLTETGFQRPIQKEIRHQVEKPQNHQESNEAEIDEGENQEKDDQETDEEKHIEQIVQLKPLNGKAAKKAVGT